MLLAGDPRTAVLFQPGRRARRSQSTPTWSCFPTLGTESPIRTPTTDGEDFRCSVKRGVSRRVDSADRDYVSLLRCGPRPLSRIDALAKTCRSQRAADTPVGERRRDSLSVVLHITDT